MSKLRSREPLPKLEQAGPPPIRDLFRRYEQMEQETEASSHTGHTRWMIPYADLLTLLLGFFVVLFAASRVETPSHAVTSMDAKADRQEAVLDSVRDPAKPANTAQKSQSVDEAKVQNPLETPAEVALAEKLERDMQSAKALPGVEILRQERGLVISLKDSILFEPGSAELSPQARKTLDRLAAQLSTAMSGEVRPIRVEGHTDNTPITTAQYPSNWELSTARATNIVRYLIASRYFSSEQLSAAGYGEFKPVENNSSIEGKQKNRRVDIVVLSADAARREPPPATPKSEPGM
ncbi:MAG TPA: OmpA family protein [Coleofasciculaceae cyanobacterium]|jgi:chemotaxis protein MotB